jgi:hypothetical protein
MIRKILGIALLCIASNFAHAQFNPMAEQQVAPTPTTNNILTGKWQEYKRTEGKRKNLKEIALDDPLQLEFMPDSSVRIWMNDGRFFVEYYEFDRAGFHFGDRYHFSFFEVNDTEMNLGDGNVKRLFKRVDKLAQGAIEKKMPGIERGDVQTDANFLIGKWSAYKKVDPNYSAKNYYLKDLKILEQSPNGDYAIGTYYSNIVESKSYDGTMQVQDNKLIIKVNDEVEEYQILKAEGAEITLSRNGYTLFLKNFLR